MSLVGSAAPAFTLVDHARQKVSLEGLLGKKVVLAFYPAAFTGVCEKEVCTFRDSLASLNELNAVVLGISTDAPFSNAAFAAKNNLNFQLLSDPSHSTVHAYNVYMDDFAGVPGLTVAKRSVFIIDERGIVTYEWVGANPGIEPDYAAITAALA